MFLVVEPDAPRELVPPRCSSFGTPGIAADTDYAGRSLKGQLTQAGRTGAATTVIVRAEDALIRRPGAQDEPVAHADLSADCHDELAYPMCGEPRKELVGAGATLAGWAARRRDHGGLVFVDLRDRTGITQLVINPELAAEAAELAHQIRNEFVLRAEGTLVARSPETVNPNMPTGEVELQVDKLEIV